MKVSILLYADSATGRTIKSLQVLAGIAPFDDENGAIAMGRHYRESGRR